MPYLKNLIKSIFSKNNNDNNIKKIIENLPEINSGGHLRYGICLPITTIFCLSSLIPKYKEYKKKQMDSLKKYITIKSKNEDTKDYFSGNITTGKMIVTLWKLQSDILSYSSILKYFTVEEIIDLLFLYEEYFYYSAKNNRLKYGHLTFQHKLLDHNIYLDDNIASPNLEILFKNTIFFQFASNDIYDANPPEFYHPKINKSNIFKDILPNSYQNNIEKIIKVLLTKNYALNLLLFITSTNDYHSLGIIKENNEIKIFDTYNYNNIKHYNILEAIELGKNRFKKEWQNKYSDYTQDINIEVGLSIISSGKLDDKIKKLFEGKYSEENLKDILNKMLIKSETNLDQKEIMSIDTTYFLNSIKIK